MASIWTDTYCEPLTYAQLGHSDWSSFSGGLHTPSVSRPAKATKVSYEGQKVRGSGAGRESEDFRRVVCEIWCNSERMNRTRTRRWQIRISALEGTGRFSKVEVDV